MYGPYTRQEADRITRDFTLLLSKASAQAGYHGNHIYMSGNIQANETGWCFDASDGAHTFCVEVYGPLVERDDA